MKSEERATVEQIDREAAANLIAAYWPNDPKMQQLAQDYRAGHVNGVWAPAFAEHRVRALTQSDARNAALEEAARVAEVLIAGREEERVIPAHDETDDYGEVLWRVPEERRRVRVMAFGKIPAAIRALIKDPTDG